MTTTSTVLTVEALDSVSDNACATAPAELVKAVREHGVTRPLVIVEAERGPVIVDGHEEYAAAKECGLTEVPVTYRPLVRVAAWLERAVSGIPYSDNATATAAAEERGDTL